LAGWPSRWALTQILVCFLSYFAAFRLIVVILFGIKQLDLLRSVMRKIRLVTITEWSQSQKKRQWKRATFTPNDTCERKTKFPDEHRVDCGVNLILQYDSCRRYHKHGYKRSPESRSAAIFHHNDSCAYSHGGKFPFPVVVITFGRCQVYSCISLVVLLYFQRARVCVRLCVCVRVCAFNLCTLA